MSVHVENYLPLCLSQICPVLNVKISVVFFHVGFWRYEMSHLKLLDPFEKKNTFETAIC